MNGGAESFEEIAHLFPDPTQVKKTLVFVDKVDHAINIADQLRQHIGWTGEKAYLVRPYFGNHAESGKLDATEDFREDEDVIFRMSS
ncbi:hypothetical protein RSOLAG22IIIB_09963 [Rhizoctonia solani]|uniref:Uncharacterized protein n=1 Tax=Rhizoctonia solani TaxID=456999 RepID=A0A0K6G0A9_9AGAM|nr:hypothetical protein RSOLAG22IIIB_09963 [Rhizoctonia solani]